jgi:isopentenyl-diphosphate Delta-isomerase
MSDRKGSPQDAGGARAAWRLDERVIAVDAGDNELGLVSRSEAHSANAIMHRAFMILLVDTDGRLLLCRRSAHKRLWPLVWADSCAGHPKPGEDVAIAASRRLGEELGCTTPLSRVGAFAYRAQYEDAGYEFELCHVFVGPACRVSPDPAEVAETGLFDPRELLALSASDPDGFAPWLIECLHTFGVEGLSLPAASPPGL